MSPLIKAIIILITLVLILKLKLYIRIMSQLLYTGWQSESMVGFVKPLHNFSYYTFYESETRTYNDNIFLNLKNRPIMSVGYTFQKSEFCAEKHTDMLVLVCSGVNNFEKRMAIRKTMLNGVPRIFLVGRTHNATAQNQLQTEMMDFGDVVLVDVMDTYSNLTLKTLAGFEWIQRHCNNSRYILKADDDAYVNVNNLKDLLKSSDYRDSIVGYKLTGVVPQRNPNFKWFVSYGAYPNDTYPDFAAGWAYVVPSHMIPKLLASCGKHEFLYLEDVFLTGICRSTFDGKILGSRHFQARLNVTNTEAVKTFIAVHFVTADLYFTIFEALNTVKLIQS